MIISLCGSCLAIAIAGLYLGFFHGWGEGGGRENMSSKGEPPPKCSPSVLNFSYWLVTGDMGYTLLSGLTFMWFLGLWIGNYPGLCLHVHVTDYDNYYSLL